MREILFRGKRKDNGEWVEGGYYHEKVGEYLTEVFIVEALTDGVVARHRVDPETVGQFTGLKDKNGKRIFEGDLFAIDDDCISVIIFKDGCFRLEVHGICGTYMESGYDECGGGYGIIECDPIDWYYIHDMVIIGNIYDHPQLLESVV